MPRRVDQEQRRAELSEAVLRVVGAGGFEAASIRAIAAEAGWSVGAVRHYFDSVADLLRFSFEQLEARLEARLVEISRGPLPPRAKARALLGELLPLDERRYAEQRLWLELVARSRFDESLRPAADRSIEAMTWVVRGAVVLLRGVVHVDQRTPLDDPALERLAADLGVFVDGLWFHGIAYPRATIADLEASLERVVDRVATAPLTGEGRPSRHGPSH